MRAVGAAAAAPSPGRHAAAAIRAHTASGISAVTEAVLAAPRAPKRRINRIPYKVLDAPSLADDFYLNVLDWSSTNALAVALGREIYLWVATTGVVHRLCAIDDEPDGVSITCVNWSNRGNHLAVGLSSGDVQIWDAAASKCTRTMRGHTSRANNAAWCGAQLATCSKDTNVYVRDVRASPDYHANLKGHRHEVCGLKWSPDGAMLASGANDNKVFVWAAASLRSGTFRSDPTPLWRFSEHKAAVKALAWSPHQSGLLASGGGTYDKTIRLHSTATGEQVSSVDVGAQVTQLVWSPHSNELASTQGFAQNSLILWAYPTMTKIATLTGHQERVLYMALNPTGENVVTGAADQTLRFWNVFPRGGGGGGGDAEELARTASVFASGGGGGGAAAAASSPSLLPFSSGKGVLSPLLDLR